MAPRTPSWRFDQIAEGDPYRASLLQAAASPTALLEAIVARFSVALASNDVRLGLEQAASHPEDSRVVLQFRVGTDLFDWFFNARTGYRAQFRISCKRGLAYNCAIIEALRHRLSATHRQIFVVRRLNALFEDCGEDNVPIDQLLKSLAPGCSKVWFCTRLIESEGDFPMGLAGPRILLEQDKSWAAPYPNDSDAWLEVKGAFWGAEGPYQPKDPTLRAKTLHLKGEA